MLCSVKVLTAALLRQRILLVLLELLKLSFLSRGVFFWLFKLQGRPASNVFFSQFDLHLGLGQ